MSVKIKELLKWNSIDPTNTANKTGIDGAFSWTGQTGQTDQVTYSLNTALIFFSDDSLLLSNTDASINGIPSSTEIVSFAGNGTTVPDYSSSIIDAHTQISNVSGLSFVLHDGASAFANGITYARGHVEFSTSSSSGIANFLVESDTVQKGDVYVSTDPLKEVNSFNPDDKGFHVLMHETLHISGLSHPSDEDVTGSNPLNAEFNNLETIMSKNIFVDDVILSSGFAVPATFDISKIYQSTLGIYDIATMQFLYGANNTHNNGDTTYTIGHATFDNTPYAINISDTIKGSSSLEGRIVTIWDAGGNDTLKVADGTTANAQLDLRSGEFTKADYLALKSSFMTDTSILAHYAQTGVVNPYKFEETNDLGIAILENAGVYYSQVGANIVMNALPNGDGGKLENAIGGDGNDTIFGNELDNNLDGGLGHDAVFGGSGDDVLIGGAGDDLLNGGVGTDKADYLTDTSGIIYNQSFGTVRDGFGDTDTLVGIEKIAGSNFNDIFTVDVPTTSLVWSEVHVDGNDGTDTLNYTGAAQVINDLNGHRIVDVFFQSFAHTYSGIENVNVSNYTVLLPEYNKNLVASDFVDASNPNFKVDYSAADAAITIDDTGLVSLAGGITHDLSSHLQEVRGSNHGDTININTFTGLTITGGQGDDTVNYNSFFGSYTYTGGMDTVIAGSGSAIGGAGLLVMIEANYKFSDLAFSFSNIDEGFDGLGFQGSGNYQKFDMTVDFGTGTNDRLTLQGVEILQTPSNPTTDIFFNNGIINITDASVGGVSFMSFTGQDAYPTQINGSMGDDVFIAQNAVNQTVYAGMGNDHFIDGGIGFQIYRGGLDYDILDYSASTDSYTVDFHQGPTTPAGRLNNADNSNIDSFSDVEEIRTGSGNDVFSSSFHDRVISGGLGNDTYTFKADGSSDTIIDAGDIDAINVISGLMLNDLSFARVDDNLVVTALDSKLTIQNHFTAGGTNAIENLIFSDGSIVDLVTLTSNLTDSNVLTGTINDDVLIGASANETIFGLAGNDIITGNGGDDTLVGGLGDDTYVFGAGDGFDTIQDIDGNNILKIEGNLDPADFTYLQVGNDLQINIASGVTIINYFTEPNTIKTIELDSGAQFNIDTLIAISNNTAPDAVDDSFTTEEDTALNGNVLLNDSDIDGDTLTVTASTLTTVNGATVDILANGDFTYTPVANFNGSDSFEYTVNDGNGGSSTALVTVEVTPAPKNLIEGTDSTDFIFGTSESDSILGLAGGDYIFGLDGDDDILAGVGRDKVFAGSGDDTISGGADKDYLFGNAGDDLINGDEGNDYIYGGWGNDELHGGIGDDYLTGNSGADDLLGNVGNDILRGGSGNDHLDGGVGSDYLVGGYGDDLLAGGLSDDIIWGGNGSDTFSFSDTDSVDTIKDFSTYQGDKIMLDDVLSGYDPLTDALSDFVNLTESSGSTQVQVDTNGAVDGTVWETIAILDNVTGLDDVNTLAAAGHIVIA